ncbi:MAG TPA: GGDEF domain-containing protein [Alphaproteobacteria bacterium]
MSRTSSAAKRSAAVESSDDAAPVDRPNDVISIMGIPEAELTPKVRTAIMGLLQEVDRLRQELEDGKKRVAFLEKLADQDTMVPIANRRAFVRELSRMIAFAERYGTPSSVLFFDINGMKVINDNLGHAAGDAAIRHVATVLTGNVRESDVVGRLGGDEFGVLLANAPMQAAVDKANSLASKIETVPFEWEGRHVPLRVAHGAHSFSGGEDPAKALDAADKAMYERKQNGRDAG